jgi:hypothetical protein
LVDFFFLVLLGLWLACDFWGMRFRMSLKLALKFGLLRRVELCVPQNR